MNKMTMAHFNTRMAFVKCQTILKYIVCQFEGKACIIDCARPVRRPDIIDYSERTGHGGHLVRNTSTHDSCKISSSSKTLSSTES